MSLAALLKTAIAPELAKSTKSKSSYVLVPAVALTFDADAPSYYLTCVLTAEYHSSANNLWRGSYRVTRDADFSVSDPLAKEKSVADISECFKEAYRLFAMHVNEKDGAYNVRTVKFKSSATSLRMPIQDIALPDRIIGNDNAGLTEFRKTAIESIE